MTKKDFGKWREGRLLEISFQGHDEGELNYFQYNKALFSRVSLTETLSEKNYKSLKLFLTVVYSVKN